MSVVEQSVYVLAGMALSGSHQQSVVNWSVPSTVNVSLPLSSVTRKTEISYVAMSGPSGCAAFEAVSRKLGRSTKTWSMPRTAPKDYPHSALEPETLFPVLEK